MWTTISFKIICLHWVNRTRVSNNQFWFRNKPQLNRARKMKQAKKRRFSYLQRALCHNIRILIRIFYLLHLRRTTLAITPPKHKVKPILLSPQQLTKISYLVNFLNLVFKTNKWWVYKLTNLLYIPNLNKCNKSIQWCKRVKSFNRVYNSNLNYNSSKCW